MPDQPGHTPQPPEERPSIGPGGPSDPREPGRGASVAVLQEILQRLQRMEGGLTQHEEWLRRIEQEQRPAGEASAEDAPPLAGANESSHGGRDAQELSRLVGELTLERDRTSRALAEAQSQLGQYQHELVALRRQTAELQNRVLDREGQLSKLKEVAQRQQSQAGSLKVEVGKQLEQREEQLQAALQRISAIQGEIAERDGRIAELQAALSASADRFDKLARQWDDAKDAQTSRAWTRFARWAVAASLLAALTSAGLLTYMFHDRQHRRDVLVSGLVTLPGADADALERIAATARERHDGLQALPDARACTIELRLAATDAHTATSAVSDIAGRILADYPAARTTLPDRPTTQPEGRSLVEGIERINARLAAPTTAPAQAQVAESIAAAADLPGRWRTLMDSRAEIAAALDDLSGELEPLPVSADSAEVTPEQIAKAEAANQQLQSELDALKTREDQLAGRLRVSIDAAGVQFQALRESFVDAETFVNKQIQEQPPEEVVEQLEVIKASLATWEQALRTLEQAWQTQRSALTGEATDALAVQAALEKASREFLTKVVAATSESNQAIERIGQGQDQTTKRLVLRNTLIKELGATTTAQQAVARAARSVVLADNVELTAIVQRLDALRRQVRQRRDQIASALRQDRVQRLQTREASRVADARRRHQALTVQMQQADAELVALGEQASRLMRQLGENLEHASEQAALRRELAVQLDRLVGMYDRFAGQVASLPSLPKPSEVPPRVLAGEPGGPSLRTLLLIGLSPLLVCGLALLVAWQNVTSRQSRETIEDYARSLKEMSRQPDLQASSIKD